MTGVIPSSACVIKIEGVRFIPPISSTRQTHHQDNNTTIALPVRLKQLLGVRSRARHVERIAPVSRTEVHNGARERAGERGDLTDVDVDEALADELSHGRKC